MTDRAAQAAETFPILTCLHVEPHPMSIPWDVAELAYSVYSERYGKAKSLKRLAELGGFYANEMDAYLPDWRERCDRMVKLQARAEHLEKVLGEVRRICQRHNNPSVNLGAHRLAAEILKAIGDGSESESEERHRNS